MKSVFYSLYDKFESKFDFFEVDIDKNRSLSKKYNINSVPTIILFKDGSIKGVLKGYNNLSKLESFINNILK
jgi:thioredoxin 1